MSARRRRGIRSRRWRAGLKAPRDSDAAVAAKFDDLARYLSTWCQTWEVCGRRDCIRAGACRGPLSCYDRHADVIFTLLNEAPCMQQFHEAVTDAEEEELVYE